MRIRMFGYELEPTTSTTTATIIINGKGRVDFSTDFVFRLVRLPYT